MADIRHSIQIASTPEAIYPLIATGNGFGQWWAEDITQAAGAVELGFFNRATVYRLKLTVNEPTTKAEWICDTGDEWSGTHIIFRLEARAKEPLLRFTHAGWRSESEYFLSCNTTWGELMFRLKSAAEGKPRGPLFRRSDMGY